MSFVLPLNHLRTVLELFARAKLPNVQNHLKELNFLAPPPPLLHACQVQNMFEGFIYFISIKCSQWCAVTNYYSND